MFIVTNKDLAATMQLISQNLLYAFEQEMRLGYLTIKGGHRIGLASKTIIENCQVKTLKNISALNIRIARSIIGCADTLMPYIIKENTVLNTLVISLPCCW